MRASRMIISLLFTGALLTGCSRQAALDQDLFLAAAMGNIKDVQRALNDGANIKARDEYGKTVLHRAFLLIQEYKSYSPKNDEEKAREESLRDFHRERIEAAKTCIPLLLHAGADPNVKDKYGATPLMLAANAGDEELAFILIQAGADLRAVDDRGRNAADYAFELNHDGLGIALRDLAKVQPTPTPAPTPPPTPVPTPAELKQRVLNSWGQKQ